MGRIHPVFDSNKSQQQSVPTRVCTCATWSPKSVCTRVCTVHTRVCNSCATHGYLAVLELNTHLYISWSLKCTFFSILDQHLLILTRNPIKQVRMCQTTQPTWRCLWFGPYNPPTLFLFRVYYKCVTHVFVTSEFVFPRSKSEADDDTDPLSTINHH